MKDAERCGSNLETVAISDNDHVSKNLHAGKLILCQHEGLHNLWDTPWNYFFINWFWAF